MAFSTPIVEKESTLVRLAFLNEALKTNGILRGSIMDLICSTIVAQIL
jgi:hypothetical protein